MPFDPKRANRVVNFIEKLCRIPSGDLVGNAFTLADWQRDEIIRPLFGTVTKDGLRQFRTAYISTARKNGKTSLLAAISLYATFGDGKRNGQVLIGANSRDQASQLFKYASEICQLSPTLRQQAEIIPHKKLIRDKVSGTTLQALSSEAPNLYGLSPHFVVLDELAFARTPDLYNALTSASGAYKDSMIFVITTASGNQSSIGYELYQYAKKIQSGDVKDPSFFQWIREVPEDVDWTLEETWHLANPAIKSGFRDIEELRREVVRAKAIPSEQFKFRVLFCNQWMSNDVLFVPMGDWNNCAERFTEDDLAGSVSFAGVDLASKHDLCAVCLAIPKDGVHYVLPYLYMPENNLREKSHQDGVDYVKWKQSGHLVTTPGDTHDFAFIESEIKRLSEKFSLHSIGIDPMQGFYLSQRLNAYGIDVFEMQQSFAYMSEPTSSLQAFVMSNKIRHPDNPVLNWNVQNLRVKVRDDGRMRPVKSNPRKKIDGAVALIMAIDRAIRNANAEIVEKAKAESFEDSVLGKYGLIVV